MQGKYSIRNARLCSVSIEIASFKHSVMKVLCNARIQVLCNARFVLCKHCEIHDCAEQILYAASILVMYKARFFNASIV